MAVRVFLVLALIGCVQCKLLNLSCQQIRSFVDGHNTRRMQLARGKVPGQPAASEMNYMIWDEELAAKAAKWASLMRFKHNPDRQIGSGRFDTGENLYTLSTTDFGYNLKLDVALEAWFNEHEDYHYGPLSMSDFGGPKQVGHYTQMVWSDTIYVGCAISQWKENEWNKFLVVCNYGPAGNYIGQTPYPSGNPARRLSCDREECRHPYGESC